MDTVRGHGRLNDTVFPNLPNSCERSSQMSPSDPNQKYDGLTGEDDEKWVWAPLLPAATISAMGAFDSTIYRAVAADPGRQPPIAHWNDQIHAGSDTSICVKSSLEGEQPH